MADYLTPSEAAAVARRHPVTIRKALEAGNLHGSQQAARGRWIIRRACLDAWITGEKCEHQATTNVRQLRRRAS